MDASRDADSQTSLDASPSSVLLEISGPDPRGVKADGKAFDASKDGRAVFSASGLLWARDADNALILGPGSLVCPFLAKRRGKVDLRRGELLSYVRSTCSLSSFQRLAVKYLGLFEIPGLQSAVESLCSGSNAWTWGWKGVSQSSWSAGHACVAVFACQLDSISFGDHDFAESSLVTTMLGQGTEILCKGSPFGCLAPAHLQGYLSKGIIATCPEQSSQFLLADLHCLPGMEGAPVTTTDSKIIGMLAAPLSSADFDAEVPVVIHARALSTAFDSWRQTISGDASAGNEQPKAGDEVNQIESHVRLDDAPHLTWRPAEPATIRRRSTDASSRLPRSIFPGRAVESVVAISSASAWASGVVVGIGGLVLTVAHVLDDDGDGQGAEEQSARHKVRTGTRGSRESVCQVRVRAASGFCWLPAVVVYRFTALDLAVLRIQSSELSLQPARLSSTELKQGQPVYVVGYALFRPRQQSCSLVSKGVLSKVISANAQAECVDTQAVVLITDAAVYPGASGGAVFSAEGHLIGIVTSNTHNAKSGRSFPKLNYSVAAATLQPVLSLLSLGPVSSRQLAALDAESAELKAVCSLDPPPQVLGSSDWDARGNSQGQQRLSELLKKSEITEPLALMVRSRL